ncbi:MAG: long-chain fatty acid--CoA ligase [Patescibacteria group bacterium]|nr:long-chain fatty acid--CoA ligase [Patescibacteria group bacterium]
MELAPTIPEAFFTITRERAEEPALWRKHDGRYEPIRHDEFADRVAALARYFQTLGVRSGARIGILSANCPEWAIADFAAMSAGAVVVPIHTTFAPETAARIIERSGISVLCAAPGAFEPLVSVLPQNGTLAHVIYIGTGSTATPPGVAAHRLEDVFAENISGAAAGFTPAAASPDDVASIVYTSGTTGLPKGVLLTHRNFLSNIAAVHARIPVVPGDIFLSFLPLSHVLERMAGHFMPLLLGGSVAYAESSKTVADDMRLMRPTVLIGVPRFFEKAYATLWERVNAGPRWKKRLFLAALKSKRGTFAHAMFDRLVFRAIRRRFGGRIRVLISGGAHLELGVAKFFRKLDLTIFDGYGLTETSPVIAVNGANELKLGTVGRAAAGVDIRIAPDKEILARGPNVMQGYVAPDGANDSDIDEDGWFHTGDMGFIDADGFLTVVGRKKELIVTSGGKNVWPEPIESRLNRETAIRQSMILGNGRKFVAALIVPEGNARYAEVEAAVVAVNAELAEHERVKKFSIISNEFTQAAGELTPTLKLSRHAIEVHHRKEIDVLYAE